MKNNDDCMYIMTYTMTGGIKNTTPLTSEQIERWINCYKKNEMFVEKIGKEYVGLNPNLIVDFKVHNKFSEHFNQINTIDQSSYELSNAYYAVSVLVKVDCKCGTVYTTETNKRKVWYCSKCKENVFLVNEDMVDTNKGKAYLLSNK